MAALLIWLGSFQFVQLPGPWLLTFQLMTVVLGEEAHRLFPKKNLQHLPMLLPHKPPTLWNHRETSIFAFSLNCRFIVFLPNLPVVSPFLCSPPPCYRFFFLLSGSSAIYYIKALRVPWCEKECFLRAPGSIRGSLSSDTQNCIIQLIKL